MTIDVKKQADQVTIAVAGRLDTTTAPALEKAISESVQEEKHLILDIKEVEYISSAGLRVLLGAQKKMQKIGSMKVLNVCEEIMEIFEMTGFADILVIE
jgi:anti-sigma B factor antagonist